MKIYPIFKAKAKNFVNFASNSGQFMNIPKGTEGTFQAVDDPNNIGSQSKILIDAKFPVQVTGTNAQYGYIRFTPKYQPANGDISQMISSDFTFSTAKSSVKNAPNYSNADGSASEFNLQHEVTIIKSIVGFTLVISIATFGFVLFKK